MAQNKNEKEKLQTVKKSINSISENKRVIAQKLLKRAEFMESTLNKLEQIIKEEGAVITTTNGNGFDVMSEHPAQKSYTALVGKYNAMMKTLLDLIPNDTGQSDALMEFIKR